MNLSLFKPIFILLLIISGAFTARAVDGSFYVGEPFDLDNPSTPGIIDAIAWYSDRNNDISIRKNSGGASVVITQYFSGTATIECQYGYTYYSGGSRRHGTGHGYFTVTCRPSTVTLNKKEITIAPGETATLSYTNSSGFKVPNPYYKTDDPDVATVEDGTWSAEQSVSVKGEKPGTCTITFYPKCGGDNPTCKVTVRDIPATGIKLNQDTLYLREGKRGSFRVVLTPSDASSSVKWTSSNESVAKVNSSSGSIEAVSEGSATITATTNNGLSATGIVTVVPAPREVHLPNVIKVTLGYYAKVTPTLTPVHSTATYRWTIEDKTVATVDSNGNIRGLTIGSTTVTVKTDNGKETSAKVEVVAPREGLDIRNVTSRVKTFRDLINRTIKQIKR